MSQTRFYYNTMPRPEQQASLFKLVEISKQAKEVNDACKTYVKYLTNQLNVDTCPYRKLVEKKIKVVKDAIKLLDSGNETDCIDHLKNNMNTLSTCRDSGFIKFFKVLAMALGSCIVGIGGYIAYRGLFVTRGQKLVENAIATLQMAKKNI